MKNAAHWLAPQSLGQLPFLYLPGQLAQGSLVGLLTPINGGIFSVEVPSSQVLLACVKLTN